jgi:hypothetical protein
MKLCNPILQPGLLRGLEVICVHAHVDREGVACEVSLSVYHMGDRIPLAMFDSHLDVSEIFGV